MVICGKAAEPSDRRVDPPASICFEFVLNLSSISLQVSSLGFNLSSIQPVRTCRALAAVGTSPLESKLRNGNAGASEHANL